MPKKATTPKESTSEKPKRSRSATKKEVSTPIPSPTKKKAATPRKSKTTDGTPKRKSKPTYEKMIFRALKHYGESTESSYIAICKFVANNYPVPDGYQRYIKVALKRAVEKGILLKIRASYRISAKGKAKTARKSRSKSTSSRSASTSPRKKSSKSSKSDKSPKKRKASSASSPSPKKKERKSTSASPSPKKSRSTSNSTKSASPSPSPSSTPKKKERKSKSTAVKSKDEAPKKPADMKHDHIWQYHHGAWKNYDTEASDTVEDVYQGYLANRGDTDVRAVKSGQWEYQVDFMAMKQTNIQHDSHTVRNIRRVKAT